MATFARIADDEMPSISVDARAIVADVDDNIYGGFTEHIGRCIYGGIYDPGNALADENGFRKDVIEALQELRVPVVRYPGGNFVATYHWLDGVGPKADRPKRPELAWDGMESNQFGTDEFLKWCEVVGTEPYFCLNFGTGTLDEALGWIEYCNSNKDTHYANLRRKHGRKEPYNVKYWALGNEVWGPWQVEQMTKEDYAKKAYQWAKAIKLLDPSVKLILCGETGYSSWDFHVIKECIKLDLHGLGGSTTVGLIDMHSIHIYTASSDHAKNATAPRAAERAIEITAGLIDLARAENHVPPTVPRQKICFDEWNVWDPVRAPGEQGAEERYTLSDALAVGVWLNVFVRQAKHVGMANIAQSVNVISPLMTTSKGVVKQTTWWPLLLFSKYMRGRTVAVNVRSGEYQGDTEPAWIRGTMDTPWLDVSAVLDNGVVNLAVVNVHEQRDFVTELAGVEASGKVEVYAVTGPGVDAVNTEEKQEVGISESTWDAVYASARDALRGGKYGTLGSPAAFKESAFYLWFKTINHHFIEIESTRTPVPQLVPQASGLVLELGPGMGNQLRRFDKAKVTRVVGVESNAHFAPDILLQVKEQGLEDVYELLTCSVDDSNALERHGIVAGSLDTVLSIQVLCSVPHPEATLKELYRLLKPGGKLIFWEHHRSSDWVTVVMQYLWNPIWSQFIGCHMTRDIPAAIATAGEWENLDSIDGDKRTWALMPRAWGVLIKPSAPA
ncbi:alpha-L-arabinofuranosidase [Purpureocillium lilacinum]|uniref:non-reducing end alpha-L-arabinofuranosidase n=1 Tax=Purpureocillium lilacinum TaxID=33203 RepID=A0A179HIF8_PURLI|nr:alpha-L-arabinofuranosidase [Purpureocillium lilacinum]OAQ89814.1 alpha-L-arabinofuranosidase [Purpureocillium lilacinum]